jgi:hypothetical protein
LITLPASIHIHLDGSAVQLEDYLNKSDRKALLREQHRDLVKVTYRFDAISHALRAAIPSTYDNTLFEHADQQGGHESSTGDRQYADKHATKHHVTLRNKSSDLIKMSQEQGYQVKVNGVVQVPNKRQTTIIAGTVVRQRTGETMPVAVRIDINTAVLLQTGEYATLAHVQMLQDGTVVIAHGKKSKRGVIKAKQVVLLDP